VEPLLVILDLDETLVYATEDALGRPPDFAVDRYHVYKRPHVDGFLYELRSEFRVAIWTASGRRYAEPVIDALFASRDQLEFLWCAERCTSHFDHETRDRNTIKKLRKVQAKGYDLARVVVVDDSPEKHVRNYGNLIEVAPFLGEPADQELPAVLAYLRQLNRHPNIRAIEKRGWRQGGAV
jgi:RNA polymerase II subunit A small phosphatase-like protein